MRGPEPFALSAAGGDLSSPRASGVGTLQRVRGPLLAAALALAAGCDGGTGGTTDAPPTLTELQADVFTPSCAFSTCHAAPGANGLVLEDGVTHGNLVDVAATTGDTLVIPGDADGSYVMHKLRDESDIAGNGMPLGGPLDDATIARVAAWIDAGALDD